jgi:hypothetical protein
VREPGDIAPHKVHGSTFHLTFFMISIWVRLAISVSIKSREIKGPLEAKTGTRVVTIWSKSLSLDAPLMTRAIWADRFQCINPDLQQGKLEIQSLKQIFPPIDRCDHVEFLTNITNYFHPSCYEPPVTARIQSVKPNKTISQKEDVAPVLHHLPSTLYDGISR